VTQKTGGGGRGIGEGRFIEREGDIGKGAEYWPRQSRTEFIWQSQWKTICEERTTKTEEGKELIRLWLEEP